MEVFVLKRICFVAALGMCAQAQANHYGMAGCGIGGLVFKDKPGMIQIVAATLNNVIPQTSAISSGTLGCYEDGGSSAKLDYIETNKMALKEDAARGQGETLQGLITLLGCQQSQTINSEIKNNYKNIFGQDSAKEILEAIQSNSTVQKSCETLG